MELLGWRALNGVEDVGILHSACLMRCVNYDVLVVEGGGVEDDDGCAEDLRVDV